MFRSRAWGGARESFQVTLQSVRGSFTLDKAHVYDQACRVAIAIVAYFRRHPDAKDNLEGIALWWVDEDLRVVEQGLSLLVELGVVKKDHDLYSLARATADRSVEGRLEELRKKTNG
ncbi:MAG: hypothetical protein M1378_01790 [Bacteroidetes bacterium]|nr:hypothetical protein [Bacteroidota bacterium]